jgi:hypothetical protein
MVFRAQQNRGQTQQQQEPKNNIDQNNFYPDSLKAVSVIVPDIPMDFLRTTRRAERRSATAKKSRGPLVPHPIIISPGAVNYI